LCRQDQLELTAREGVQHVARPHPRRRDELAAVVLTFVLVGCSRDEEPSVVAARRTLGRDPTRELDERRGIERDPALLETLTSGGDAELVETGLPGEHRILGVDRTAGKDGRAGREHERGAPPQHEDVEIGPVAHENHRCGVPHRFRGTTDLHDPSLRGRRNLPVVEPADRRRALPSVERVLHTLDASLPHAVRVRLAREAVAAAREGLIAPDDVVADAQRRAEEYALELLGPVVNATGVLLHTNLGRAPLGADAVNAMCAAAGYTNVEYRIAAGERGSRHEHAGALLAAACGAEAGIVVNNNAAAVLLVLAALARGRSVLVSRGELVEIGGGFRVPEILAETGARLVEVGTTNRTRVNDYTRARAEDVALLLKVHASNYRMVGFVESTPVAELAALGAAPVVVDAGSGLLDATTPWLQARPAWLGDEPGVAQCLADGAALVTFSGDKLLGGPQAGVIVGAQSLIDRLAAHPLARALRADKMTLAALQAVAFAYLDGDVTRIPFWRMATTTVDALRLRAEAIAAAVPGAKVVHIEAVAGGGSVPGLGIPSCGVAIEAARPDERARELRTLRIVARIDDGRVVCDLRTVDPADDARLRDALQ